MPGNRPMKVTYHGGKLCDEGDKITLKHVPAHHVVQAHYSGSHGLRGQFDVLTSGIEDTPERQDQ